MESKDFLIVIPAYNEEATIKELVSRAKKYADVCVVDDCSKDSTAQILSQIEGIYVITHKKNTHIPGAVLDGFRYAYNKGYKYAITLDAGLSHNPDEIPLFMNYRHVDLLLGKRTKKIKTPLLRKILSLAGNFIYNVSLDFGKSFLRGRYYCDICSGFRRYSHEAVRLLLSKSLESKSFDFLFESAMLIYRNKLEISEVPISYTFSNSSLKPAVITDCLAMCFKTIFKHIVSRNN